MTTTSRLLSRIQLAAQAVTAAGGAFSGETAAHVHLAAATGTQPDGPARYVALAPRRIEAVFPVEARSAQGVESARGAVADVLRVRLDLFATEIAVASTRVPVLSREAAAADLLARGGLALGVLGVLVRITGRVDADEVREILKAARRGECFQPLLELLDVA